MKTDWMADAELIYWNEYDQWLLGEDQHGDWWIPYVPVHRAPHWERYNRWNPTHWACYWNSRRRNQIVFLDWDVVATTDDPAAWTKPDA